MSDITTTEGGLRVPQHDNLGPHEHREPVGIFGWPSNYITMGTTFEYLLHFANPPADGHGGMNGRNAHAAPVNGANALSSEQARPDSVEPARG